VLPFLPSEPVTALSEITPRQVWLAVVAVCTVSYASYLLQRYVAPRDGGLWAAVLGGLYSSTATTVVLARRVRAAPDLLREAQTGIILATSIMYLRMLIIIALFNQALAIALTPALLGLAAFGLLLAGLWYRMRGAPTGVPSPSNTPANPLELTAALIFAQVLNLDELSWFITLVSGEEFLPICHRKIAALKENSLLPDAGSKTSPAKPSRILFLIANRIMSIYRRFDRSKY
jgi:uncharacterized membrane protein (DUF4010 family)